MASESKTGLLADPIYTKHDTGPNHPESPQRFEAVRSALTAAGLTKLMTPIESRVATEDELASCHGRDYIAIASRDVHAGRSELSTGDTAISAASLDVALRAAGGVLNAVDAVMRREVDNAFCAVRPPGHHARPDQGMGFCLFNNVAIAGRYAQRKYGIDRVLIVDWDVHHGNGTQDIFYEDPSVFFFSTHQWPWYPGTGPASETGEGKAEGCTMNRPLPAGAGRQEVLGLFETDLRHAADHFQPDLVLISAGFDSRIGDPLGGFKLEDRDFADLTTLMLEIADRHASGRLVSVLEGGYNLSGLGTASTAHVKALLQDPKAGV
jgi:acetoin utilization deacetylase AcuC-like enzyme